MARLKTLIGLVLLILALSLSACTAAPPPPPPEKNLATTQEGGGPPDATPVPAEPDPNRTPSRTPDPFLRLKRITPEEADRVQLLRTMSIPDYQMGPVSQCSLDFSPDGRLLVGACGVSPVPVWDVMSGAILHTLYPNPAQIVACAFSPDGETIACGGFDRQISYWNAGTGERLSGSSAHDSLVWDLAFGPEAGTLASCSIAEGASKNGDIRLWGGLNREMSWLYQGEGSYLSLDFHPLGESVAYGGRWGSVGLLDVVSGESLAALDGPQDAVGDVAFSPSGDLLAAGSDDRSIYLWGTEDHQLVATLSGHLHFVNGLAFSPDETLLVSGSHDRTLGIWDLAGQRLLTTLTGHEGQVLRVAVSPDGRLIASISWDGTVRLWGAPSPE